jgi:hypothetical protein
VAGLKHLESQGKESILHKDWRRVTKNEDIPKGLTVQAVEEMRVANEERLA